MLKQWEIISSVSVLLLSDVPKCCPLVTVRFQMCGNAFDGGSFFDHQGMPLCEQHYHEKRGSLCAECRQPISGRCVSAIGLKFHPEHFRCTYCARQLTKGTFKEVNRKPFCHKCYQTTQAISWEYIVLVWFLVFHSYFVFNKNASQWKNCLLDYTQLIHSKLKHSS